MRTLLEETFAPITSSVGFLQLPLSGASRGLVDWRRSLSGDVRVTDLEGGLPDVLPRLEPLTAGARPRELLVAAGKWTAYFDNLLNGTDAVSAVGYLSQRLACFGLAIGTHPHIVGRPGVPDRFGSVQFQLFGPQRTEFLNFVRTVALSFDDKWVFGATGEVQPYEETQAYQSRNVRDRFSSEMLERYCLALGLDVFNPAAYGPKAVLVESKVAMPRQTLSMTLAEAQRRAGIEPGLAASLPG